MKIVIEPEAALGDRVGRPRAAVGARQHLAALTVMFGALLLGLLQLLPPAPVPAAAPAAVFSAERARQHLAAIATEPHPAGSPAHDRVRRYLAQELNKLGLRPETQRAAVASELFGQVTAGQVENIMVRLPGTGARRAVLLVAHYDTVPSGPGANDNGVAVAAMLESIRALRAVGPLRNDLIFLFSDGEEIGLLGAQAFLREHAWARDVALVLNFDARGANGPLLMFETSAGNTGLIADFIAAAPAPVAGSFFSDVYRILGNATDFTVFNRAGLPGLNFAYLGDSIHYHSAIDTLDHVDPRTLQQVGATITALAGYFGGDELDAPATGDAVFFNLVSHQMVWYPVWLVVPLTVLAALALGAVLVIGTLRRSLTARGIAIGLVGLLLGIVLAYLSVTLLLRSILLVRADFQQLPDLYRNNLYILSFILLALALQIGLYHGLLRYSAPADLLAGALLGWLLLAGLTAALLPGGSYLFLWPLLAASAGLGLVTLPARAASGWRTVLLTVAAVPALLILPPVIVLFFETLGVTQPLPALALTALLASLLVPYLATIGARRLALAGALAVPALALALATAALTTFDARSPKPNSVFYALDADSGRALWLSNDPQPDAWLAQFFGDRPAPAALPPYLALESGQYLQAPAPALPLARPQATLLEDTSRDNRRSLRLRLTSPRGATTIWLLVESSAELLSASVDGQAAPIPAGGAAHERRWLMRYWTLPPEGIEVTLTTSAEAELRIRLIDQTFALPAPSEAGYVARPPALMPKPYGSDHIFVSTQIDLAAARLGPPDLSHAAPRR